MRNYWVKRIAGSLWNEKSGGKAAFLTCELIQVDLQDADGGVQVRNSSTLVRSLKGQEGGLAPALFLQNCLRNRAAVNDHHFAVHEAVPIAHHECRILREFFRTTEPAGRCPKVMHL